MLGYSSAQSSQEVLEHHRHLKERVPERLHENLDYVYKWINDKNFMKALDCNTVEGWTWLRTAMANPPLRVIRKLSSTACKHVELESHIPCVKIPTQPTCRVCKQSIARNVSEKCKFSMVICNCETLWCHQHCAEESVAKDAQCQVCKEYFILSHHCSPLRSTFLKR